MAQIIVTPKEMRVFAAELQHLSADLREKQMRMEAELQTLGVSWQDQRYRRFSTMVTTASLQLTAFHNRAKAYVDYLMRKAAAGDAFLRRG